LGLEPFLIARVIGEAFANSTNTVIGRCVNVRPQNRTDLTHEESALTAAADNQSMVARFLLVFMMKSNNRTGQNIHSWI